MKEVNKEVLKDAAERLLFELSDHELDTLLKEFEVISKQMRLIGDIEGVDELSPMTFPFEVTTSYLREDVVTTPLTREEVLSNAAVTKSGEIMLPKVVG